MSGVGHTAMVLAAGLGQRMRPITLTTPKPLVTVGGQPLIAHVFDRLREAGVATAVVNVHHLADQVEAWATAQPGIHVVISDERETLLDTGGGVARALPLLGPDPFLVINSDSFWIDRGTPALDRLRRHWDDAAMDCLLLLCPLTQTVGHDGRADFVTDSAGRVRRFSAGDSGPLVYIGACLVSPRLFGDCPAGAFSMNRLWDRAIAEGRLFGIVHDGLWLHVGTPEAIARAQQALQDLPR